MAKLRFLSEMNNGVAMLAGKLRSVWKDSLINDEMNAWAASKVSHVSSWTVQTLETL